MYYAHFGLHEPPFRITPNTGFFFSGGNRGAILEALIYAIMQGEGIIKVTGEVGSGKTMLCNMLQARLPAAVETVYIAHPNVTPEEIVHSIAFELQLAVERTAPRVEVMQRLQEHLLRRHAEGRRVVMFVEEAQGMPLATLEEIRLLSNLETRDDKLLQIVLFGQPELDGNLLMSGIRQLKERITQSFHLGPLNAGEIREYLMFRLRAAGYRGPDLFSRAVVATIARASRGLTRRINLIADKTLLAAFSENTHTVRMRHVKAAVRDTEFGKPLPAAARRYAWGVALLGIGATAGALAYGWIVDRANEPRLAAPSQMAARTVARAQTRVGPATAERAERPVDAPAVRTTEPAIAAGVAPSIAAEPVEAPLIERRFAATRDWLAAAAPSIYSIQLMGIDDETQLTRHLNDIAKSVEIDKVFLYRTVANRKASLTVLYGSFSDRRAAQSALDGLPSALKANRPILRTVRGIRTEIMQQRSS
jgi:type II secretory pathway predicted ATPase ExeA